MQQLRFLNPRRFILLITCLLLAMPSHAAKNSNADYIAFLWKSYNVDYLLENMKASMYSGENNIIGGLEQANADKIKAIVDKNYVDKCAHERVHGQAGA